MQLEVATGVIAGNVLNALVEGQKSSPPAFGAPAQMDLFAEFTAEPAPRPSPRPARAIVRRPRGTPHQQPDLIDLLASLDHAAEVVAARAAERRLKSKTKTEIQPTPMPFEADVAFFDGDGALVGQGVLVSSPARLKALYAGQCYEGRRVERLITSCMAAGAEVSLLTASCLGEMAAAQQRFHGGKITAKNRARRVRAI